MNCPFTGSSCPAEVPISWQGPLALSLSYGGLFSQLRRSKLLATVYAYLAQKPQPESGEFLFGSGFTKYLKDEVEADFSLAEVDSLSQHYHPYSSNASICLSICISQQHQHMLRILFTFSVVSESLSNSLSISSAYIHIVGPHTFSSADCIFANSALSLLQELLFSYSSLL